MNTEIQELIHFIENDRMQSSYTKEQVIELLTFKLEKQKEQTAVEFLEEQIRYYISNDDRLYNMFKQSKELENGQMIAFGKKCFYKGFEKAENDDANCFTAWIEEANELLTFKSE